MSENDEREFLKLAGIYLACRWQVMGGEVSTGVPQKKGDPIKTFHFAMLGLHDYQWEMELLIQREQIKYGFMRTTGTYTKERVKEIWGIDL